MKPLREHQTKAIGLLRDALRRGAKRPMLQLPTGAGKTRIASEVINLARAKGNRVIFTVPAISLVDQTAREFYAEGIRDVGVMQANHPMTDASKPVQIASIQTLQRRSIPEAGLVIVDEAHKVFDFVGDWMARDEWLGVPFIGLSATPWTKGLGRLYDALIVGSTTAELIEAGYLSPFKVFAPSHPDLKGVRTVAGDFHEGDLAKVMNPLIGDVVTTWLERGEGRPTLCFAVDRKHASLLQEQFEGAGVACGYVDKDTDLLERERIRKRFAAGDLKVVCNVGVLTTGVDWDVRCIILARPTKSEILFTQIIGRGLRTADGKADCLARDTLILTDQGEVRIQDITLDHKLWDGVNYVTHGGAVCKGKQRVITYDGVTATPDHRVMTNGGWKALADAARHGERIARTGLGGHALRLADDHLGQDRRLDVQAAGRSFLRAVRALAHGAVPQHSEAAGHAGMPALQWARAGDGAALAISPLPIAAGSLSESTLEVLRALWRTWDRVSLRLAERGCTLDRRQSGRGGSLDGDRPDRQRRAVCAGQSSVGELGCEHEQHASVRAPRALHRLQAGASGGAIRGQDAGEARWFPDGRGDHRALAQPISQTEGEVWDVLNAGPLQRFTANGRLVHNCLILDHSDSTLRLGFVTDIHHDRLDGGKLADANAPLEPKAAAPKECPKCSRLVPRGVAQCPSCGHKPERASGGVEWREGELIELDSVRRKQNADAGWPEKVSFMRQLKAHALVKGKAEGWVAHKYRAKFGVWPNDPRVRYVLPAAGVTPEVASWLKAQAIRYAKGIAKTRAG